MHKITSWPNGLALGAALFISLATSGAVQTRAHAAGVVADTLGISREIDRGNEVGYTGGDTSYVSPMSSLSADTPNTFPKSREVQPGDPATDARLDMLSLRMAKGRVVQVAEADNACPSTALQVADLQGKVAGLQVSKASKRATLNEINTISRVCQDISWMPGVLLKAFNEHEQAISQNKDVALGFTQLVWLFAIAAELQMYENHSSDKMPTVNFANIKERQVEVFSHFPRESMAAIERIKRYLNEAVVRYKKERTRLREMEKEIAKLNEQIADSDRRIAADTAATAADNEEIRRINAMLVELSQIR